MKLLHLANFNSTNIGNGALIFGTERVLREDLKTELQFTAEPWDEYVIENAFGPRKFDEGFVDLVNKHDGLLVGGAVTFNGRAHLTETGMRFNLPLKLWPRIRKPIIFYGNSYRFWPSQTYHNVDKLRETLEYIIHAPHVFFGVRNDGTKEFIESLLGFHSKKILSIPDPGMYVPAEENDYPEIAEKKMNVLISLNDEDKQDRFPSREKKLRFLRALARVMERLVQEFDVNFILCPHYFDDYKIMSEFIEFLPPKIVHQRTVSTGLLTVPKTPYFYGRYAKIDLAFSMRIHSLSPAIGLGIPIVPLISQTRVADFLEEIGLMNLGVDIFAEDIEEEVYMKASHALSHGTEVRQKVRRAAATSRERTLRVNEHIQQILRDCGASNAGDVGERYHHTYDESI
ncbi:polysaccharide pyruvyl transferase family protein [Patescibacteria group bacterium]|nr:polysaccharide pyruvyl transferase family protein [Patescibacteria group bacterium]